MCFEIVNDVSSCFLQSEVFFFSFVLCFVENSGFWNIAGLDMCSRYLLRVIYKMLLSFSS